jgi:hypothetical protein
LTGFQLAFATCAQSSDNAIAATRVDATVLVGNHHSKKSGCGPDRASWRLPEASKIAV